VKDSQVVFQKGYGFRNANTSDPVTPQTVFRIGSLSKGFAGVLAGILVQQKLLQWEERVRTHLPAFRLKDAQQADRIQLWHLLSHTTGLPYHAYTHLIEEGLDLPEIMNGYFPKSPVCGKEGEFYAYQNAAFCLAGSMMQSVTGESYADLLKKRILQPAGMKSTSCSFEGIMNTENRALPHTKVGNHWVPQPIERSYYNAIEAGGINASVEDMGKWLLLLLGHRPEIIGKEALEEVFHPVVKTGKERKIQGGWISRDEASYAMGWRVLEHGGQTILYHGGYVNGFRGEIALDRQAGIGVCVLFNGPSDLASDCIQAFFEQYAMTAAKKDTLY
jgi:beta-lactamase class C